MGAANSLHAWLFVEHVALLRIPRLKNMFLIAGWADKIHGKTIQVLVPPSLCVVLACNLGIQCFDLRL
jgi:hypothetical protein